MSGLSKFVNTLKLNIVPSTYISWYCTFQVEPVTPTRIQQIWQYQIVPTKIILDSTLTRKSARYVCKPIQEKNHKV